MNPEDHGVSFVVFRTIARPLHFNQNKQF